MAFTPDAVRTTKEQYFLLTWFFGPFLNDVLFYFNGITVKYWKALKKWSFLTLREKCLYSEFFWAVFSRIWSEYEEILHISPHSWRMRENTDQKISEDGHFLRSLIDDKN